MRLRHIAGAQETVAAHPLVITEAKALGLAGQWQSCYQQPQPLVLEIGMGRGRFITNQAQADPHRNYLGLEMRAETILDALQRCKEQQPANLRFLNANALGLAEYFAPAEVAEIYLLFSDPWPKKRHAKRRLTAPSFLDLYGKILHPAGSLIYKTDGAAFYDWSLACFAEHGWQLLESSRDWPLLDTEVISEYETRFRKRGQPIFYARLARPAQQT